MNSIDETFMVQRLDATGKVKFQYATGFEDISPVSVLNDGRFVFTGDGGKNSIDGRVTVISAEGQLVTERSIHTNTFESFLDRPVVLAQKNRIAVTSTGGFVYLIDLN